VGKKGATKEGVKKRSVSSGGSAGGGKFGLELYDFGSDGLLQLCERHELERKKVAQLLSN